MQNTSKLTKTAALLAVTPLLAHPLAAQTPQNALVMAWNIDSISSFDPAQVGEVVTNEILQNTCDTLVSFDPDNEAEVLPALAKSWEISEDGRRFTFHLNEGAVFPSGNPVTAQDTVWSLHRVITLGYGNSAQLTDYGFTAENKEELIYATDDHTVVLEFTDSFPASLLLQDIAANRVASTLDMQTIMAGEQDGDLGNAYLNTRTECVGPYRLAQWNQGESVVLQANEDYYGDAPGLERVLIRHVAETGTQRLLVERGDVDVARDLTPEDLRDLEAMDGIGIETALKPQLIFWTFNNLNENFADYRVRLAMKYLIDYEGLGETVMQYLGQPWNSFVQSGAFGAFEPEEGVIFRQDLDRARELLAEAGMEDGFEATVYIGSLPWSSPLAQHVQENAAQVGVTLNIEQMANAQFFARVRARDFESGIMAWQTGVPDAHGNASRLVMNPDNSDEAQLTQYPSWRAGYQDEALNALVMEAATETDPERRRALYAELQNEWMQTGGLAIMFQTFHVAAVRETLNDWTWNGFKVYYSAAWK
jgi:peptide/nickel transport system substrate-binding protein